MELTFAPRGILQIDNARIIHRNFSGNGSQYNREGDRNFSLIIPEREMADALIKEGWNIKIREPRDEYEEPLMFLRVSVKFNERGPQVYLKTSKNMNKLDEETVGMLDDVYITNVDLDIRPYDWGPINGKCGRTAYLKSMCVTQEIDRFTARYEEDELLGE